MLLPVMDGYQQLWRKIIEGYKWVLKFTTAAWILTIRADTFVKFDRFEYYLQHTFDPVENIYFRIYDRNNTCSWQERI